MWRFTHRFLHRFLSFTHKKNHCNYRLFKHNIYNNIYKMTTDLHWKYTEIISTPMFFMPDILKYVYASFDLIQVSDVVISERK